MDPADEEVGAGGNAAKHEHAPRIALHGGGQGAFARAELGRARLDHRDRRARRLDRAVEGDDPATCEGTPTAVPRAEEGIRTRVANAPSRANLPALNAEPFDRVFLMEGVGGWRPSLAASQSRGSW